APRSGVRQAEGARRRCRDRPPRTGRLTERSTLQRKGREGRRKGRDGQIPFAYLAYPLAAFALKRFLFADQGQDEVAAVGGGAVLEQEDSLPGADLDLAITDRDRQLYLGQRALQMRRHVVRP